MAYCDAVYVIKDKLLGSDVFAFMAQHDGIAKGHLHSFCNRLQRSDFSLYRITAFDYADEQLTVVDIERVYICDASPDYLENEDEIFDA
ncbi:hypothetical protein [Salmonella enterica]|uniref:hypothetical protein n=1 Tax=Salmonella enterica TaxID=28901 RepID=UPI0009ADAB16|nr:hypothetical protein [Salmonella enterica]